MQNNKSKFKTNNEWDIELIKKLENLGKQNKYKEYLNTIDEAFERVEIHDNGEKMLYLPKHLPKTMFLNPDKEASKLQLFYLREGIIERLKRAQKKLPNGYHLWLANTTRTEKIVLKLYNKYIKEVKKNEPRLSNEEADLKIRNILAMPDDKIPPGHMTGGALDVILADDNGKKIPMKVSYEKISREVQSFTFYDKLPKEIKKNRKILYDIMIKVGFQNYFREFWHYSYGDAYWAVRRKNKIAVYGIPPKKLWEEVKN